VAEFVAAWAAQAGLDIEFQNVQGRRRNVLARLTPPKPPLQRILLAPHLDTVNAADPAQFNPLKSGERIRGRGACDTKGSVAVMLTALAETARSRNRPQKTEILFVGLVDEENEQVGSRAFAASKPRAELAIVGEPTRLRVVTAHKGNLWMRLETRGRAAHGATPELGRNAVHEMARVVDVIETRYGADLKKRRHRLLGNPTASVGRICGGTQANIVPDHCEIEVDRRTLPGETERTVRDELHALLRKVNCTAHISLAKTVDCPPMETSPSLPFVKAFLRSNGQRKPEGVHFFCDAAILSQAGIPSVVFGPGDIAQAHTANEWIAVSSLNRAVDLLRQFFQSLP
jgi:acetylornithine deacetylase/succinyl-diaminopimelate desuccinylase-like protein